MGKGTRSEVKKAISKGLVRVNNVIVKKPETKLDTDSDHVLFDGVLVGYAQHEYYMLNKPAGVISATEHVDCVRLLRRRWRTPCLIIERKRKDLFPVGRLDRDTEGLLLISNDGELAHRLLSPSKHVDKVYYAKIDGEVTIEDVEAFQQGVDIGKEKLTRPAKLRVLKSGTQSEIELTICEGKFHQVKRMFQAVGKEVVYLKRLQMGTLILDESLKPGEYRELTEQEIADLCFYQ